VTIRTDLQWAGVDYLFALGVCEPTVRKGNDADRNQNDPDDAYRFHGAANLKRPSTLDQVNDQDYHRDDEQDMNEPAHRV